MIGRLLNNVKGVVRSFYGNATSSGQIATIAKVQAMRDAYNDIKENYPGSVSLKGYKVYSQNDEDGIISAIFSAIGGGETFLEIGVEDGRECNSHYLAILGWRGAWVEANAASAYAIEVGLGGRVFPNRFKLIQDYARSDNIVSIYRDVCGFLKTTQLDLFSLDIDGNDLYVLDALMASDARPVVICLEYNGKFPPPARVAVAKDETRGWAQDDYFGASLQSFYDVLSNAGYVLVGCNVSGTNAFFVRQDQTGDLESYTPEEAWQPLRPYLTALPTAHLPTLKFMKDALHQPMERD